MDTKKRTTFKSRFKKGTPGLGIFMLLFGSVWNGIVIAGTTVASQEGVVFVPFFMLPFIAAGVFLYTMAIMEFINAVSFKKITNLILTQGHVTKGYIRKAEYRYYSTKNSSGYRHTISYSYQDDKGDHYLETFKFSQSSKQLYTIGSEVSVVFYDGMAMLLETYTLCTRNRASKVCAYSGGALHTAAQSGVVLRSMAEGGITQAQAQTRTLAAEKFAHLLDGKSLRINTSRPYEIEGVPQRSTLTAGVIVLLIGLGIFSGLFFGGALPNYLSTDFGSTGTAVVFTFISMFMGVPVSTIGGVIVALTLKALKRGKQIKATYTVTLGIRLYKKFTASPFPNFSSVRTVESPNILPNDYMYKDRRGRLHFNNEANQKRGCMGILTNTTGITQAGRIDYNNARPAFNDFYLDNTFDADYCLIAYDEISDDSARIRTASVL